MRREGLSRSKDDVHEHQVIETDKKGFTSDLKQDVLCHFCSILEPGLEGVGRGVAPASLDQLEGRVTRNGKHDVVRVKVSSLVDSLAENYKKIKISENILLDF